MADHSETGIREVEEKARLCEKFAQTTKLHETSRIPVCTEEKLEVITRCLVREDFGETLGARGIASNTQALERVLFDRIYPCPGGQT